MDAASQQRILGYFIEEAKEHLDTLEKGILELSSITEDTERINELFRAAHSLKGGAAMLGYSGIQKTAHRLEDSFKIFREHEIPVDQRLENLFLRAFDVLQHLIQRLETPQGLSEAESTALMQEAEPSFVQLQDYLNQLLGDQNIEPEESEVPSPSVVRIINRPQGQTIPPSELPPLIKRLLKQMLEIFKEKETLENRQQLQELCLNLAQLAPKEQGWQKLVKTCQSAISNPKYSYQLLAPVVIKELKNACDQLQIDQGKEIAPSQGLQQMASMKSPQILVPLDPHAAAGALIKVFNKEQLSLLVDLIKAKR